MPQYLDFNQISKDITFTQVLNWLCIPFTEKKGELRGKIGEDAFIANITKNTFFCPKNQTIKGGIINFTSQSLNLSLRDAALSLKTHFLEEAPPKELPNLELHYCKFLEDFGINYDTAVKYEVGLVKQKSIISGRIAFKVYDEVGKHIGYVGYHPEKKDWFFPKNFKRPLYNYYLCRGNKGIFLTFNPFISIYLQQLNLNSCSLLGISMSEPQEELLRNFGNITLIHNEPENIVNRLCRFTYVKAPKLTKSLKDYSAEEIVCF